METHHKAIVGIVIFVIILLVLIFAFACCGKKKKCCEPSHCEDDDHHSDNDGITIFQAIQTPPARLLVNNGTLTSLQPVVKVDVQKCHTVILTGEAHFEYPGGVLDPVASTLKLQLLMDGLPITGEPALFYVLARENTLNGVGAHLIFTRQFSFTPVAGTHVFTLAASATTPNVFYDAAVVRVDLVNL